MIGKFIFHLIFMLSVYYIMTWLIDFNYISFFSGYAFTVLIGEAIMHWSNREPAKKKEKPKHGDRIGSVYFAVCFRCVVQEFIRYPPINKWYCIECEGQMAAKTLNEKVFTNEEIDITDEAIIVKNKLLGEKQ